MSDVEKWEGQHRAQQRAPWQVYPGVKVTVGRTLEGSKNEAPATCQDIVPGALLSLGFGAMASERALKL